MITFCFIIVFYYVQVRISMLFNFYINISYTDNHGERYYTHIFSFSWKLFEILK